MDYGRLVVARLDLGYDRHADSQDRARPVAPVARHDPPAQRFDKPATNCKTQTGTGAPAILRSNAVEFIEDPLKIARRNPWPLVDDFYLDKITVTLRANIDSATSGRVFRRVVEEIE